MSFCPIPAAMPGGQPNPASSLGRVSLGIRGWGREAARSPFSNCKSQFFSFFFPLMTVGSPYKKPERRERGVGRDQAPAAALGGRWCRERFPSQELAQSGTVSRVRSVWQLVPPSGIHPAEPFSDVIHLPYFRCWLWEGISCAL